MEFLQVDLWYIIAVIGVILFSMTFHEAMHGFVAYWLGDSTAKLQGRLSLNPIKHIDPFLTIILPVVLALIPGAPIFGGAKPVPFNPQQVRWGEWGVAMVAIAGPLTNLIIAFLSFACWYLLGLPDTSSIEGTILLLSIKVNLGFFVFNILPIPPLDGSRLLYALSPDFVRRGMEVIEQFGIVLVFAIVFVASPLIGQFMSSAIQLFFSFFQVVFGIG